MRLFRSSPPALVWVFSNENGPSGVSEGPLAVSLVVLVPYGTVTTRLVALEAPQPSVTVSVTV